MKHIFYKAISAKYTAYLFFLFVSIQVFSQRATIDLSGEWNVKLDTLSTFWTDKSAEFCKKNGTIMLPSSLAEAGYGYRTTGSDFGILTPEFRYIGKAWYSREISIPSSWKNKEIEVVLERVLWESRVYINGQELSRQDALGTAHVHKLGIIPPGNHLLTIQVDNEMIHNIGDKGHAYSDYTQSIWNGIVGRIELQAYDGVRINSAKAFSDIKNDKLSIAISLNQIPATNASIKYAIKSIKSGKTIIQGRTRQSDFTGTNDLLLEIQARDKLIPWSEFTPEVYSLELRLISGRNRDTYQSEFGFHQISHDGTKVLINGDPVFLRGNLDCVHFPITGYASCSIEDWERIFTIYKQYGLNHVRFHSWCPPEAAFRAANRIGIYMQAEASIWIDWWMSTDMVERGRPEMDTKGHPSGLGYDAVRDSFVVAEMHRVVDFYGNHPSFSMFCIGNELGNSDFEVMNEWIAELKAKDPRRLYAASTARKINPTDDYMATHMIQGIGRTRGLNGPHTDWDFESTYGKMDIPIIAHEIGQWPVYPRWAEIDKYTGVLKARNFEDFREVAIKNGIADQSDDFADASGALNQIMYKYEIESFFRTPSCAGIQLLSMQDYQGQGEALIGWLDAHWDSKNITTPALFRQHHTTTVPLLRIPKFVYTTNETFKATAELSHHGQVQLDAGVNWKIIDNQGKVLSSGDFGNFQFPLGSNTHLGQIEFQLNKFKGAEQLTIVLEVEGTDFRNQWNIWVYPFKMAESENNVRITNTLDSPTLEALQNGANVLLIAHESGTSESAVLAHFYPLYWSLTFFPGQGKTCIGLWLQEHHPAFNYFPTSFHSDWQWETISSDAKAFILNELPLHYRPIAQPIDDFHRNNKLGSIFEVKVGKGKLIVCGYNVGADLPVARQLKHSLIRYMNSADFAPTTTVSSEWLQATLPSIPIASGSNIPGEFSNALLYVDAAANQRTLSTSEPWSIGKDSIVQLKNTSYQLRADGVWKDAVGSAWHGQQMQLTINCPDGMLGTLYVHFHDWNSNGRSGILEFEGRKLKLERHDGEGQWVQFHVMREDSNDGTLLLRTTTTSGPNLMISKIVLVQE